VLDLEPLTELESTSLAQSLLADDPNADEALATRIARESQGWPVFVHALCDHVRVGAKGDQPVSLHAVIEGRLRRLSAGRRPAGGLLAGGGRPVRGGGGGPGARGAPGHRPPAGGASPP